MVIPINDQHLQRTGPGRRPIGFLTSTNIGMSSTRRWNPKLGTLPSVCRWISRNLHRASSSKRSAIPFLAASLMHSMRFETDIGSRHVWFLSYVADLEKTMQGLWQLVSVQSFAHANTPSAGQHASPVRSMDVKMDELPPCESMSPHMLVSWNRGTPKSSICRWDFFIFFPWNQPPILDTPFMETPYEVTKLPIQGLTQQTSAFALGKRGPVPKLHLGW